MERSCQNSDEVCEFTTERRELDPSLFLLLQKKSTPLILPSNLLFPLRRPHRDSLNLAAHVWGEKFGISFLFLWVFSTLDSST